MAPQMDENSGATVLFDNAMKNFRASLSSEDQTQFRSFSTSVAMIADLKPQIQDVQQHRIGQIVFRKISSISELWQPYFDTLSILVSAHPEYCAFFWGVIRFVLLVGHHYVTFFEKTIDLLDEISRSVSIKSEYLKQIEEWQKDGGKGKSTGLLAILGAIYYDAISFCQQLYQVFGSARKGLRKKARMLSHTLWVPFDKRYAEVLSRMKQHELAFAEEMKLANTRISVSSYKLLGEYIEEARLDRKEQRELIEEQNAAALRLQLGKIQIWVRGTEYRRTFESIKCGLAPGAGSWFLDAPAYQIWLSSGESITDREITTDSGVILSVLGAPGYGKTVLSVVVLEDLCSRIQFTNNEELRDQCVLYFHFHGSRTDEDSSDPAFRSILAQLLYQRQNDKELLNAALMLMYTRGTGQQIAPEDEVDEVLCFGLRLTVNNFIVIDGIDECSDQASFFRRLRNIYNICNCHIMLFCRPTVGVPKDFSQKHIQFRLKRGQNYNDIKRYIQPHVIEMMESGMIPHSYDGDDLVCQIARRASSLFLLGKLMVNYLECIALTPRDRANAIENITSFEGLNQVIKKIVLLIRCQPLRQQETAFRVFQLLKVSYRPFTVQELETATAVQVGRATSKELDYIVNFEKSIVQICGALIEVCDDQRFDFIHSSVPDYLARDVHEGGMWTLNTTSAHTLAANICLSYLIHDLTPLPLAGSSNTTPHSLVIGRALPLLEYASQNWSDHAAHTLKVLKDFNQWKSLGIEELLLSLQSSLETFLINSNTICAWIEASYLFHHPPNLNVLVNAAGALRDSDSGKLESQKDPLRWVERISKLTSDLSNLDHEWGHLLASEPNEIWEPSIRLFTVSQFWSIDNSKQKLIQPSNGELKYIDCHDDPPPRMLLITKVSAEGDNVASLTLLPPTVFIDRDSGFFAAASNGLFHRNMRDISNYIKIVSHGWSVRYQLKRLDKFEDIRLEVMFGVPPEDISFAIYNSVSNGKANPGRIDIACSLSDDLQDISVMHSVSRVLETGGIMNVEGKGMQILDLSEIRGAAAYWEREIPLQPASFPTWLWTRFSPYGFYFLAFRGDGRLFLFEERPYRATCTISWKYIAQTTSSSISNPIFHPMKPLICLIVNNSTWMWSFESQAPSDIHKMLPYELINPTFTQCGQYLEGWHREAAEARAKAVTLPLSTILEPCHSKGILKDIDEAIRIPMAVPDEGEGRLQGYHVSDGVTGSGGNHIKRQKLTQYTHEAAIILEHPTEPSRTVFRLPRSLAATNIDAIVTLSTRGESRIFVSLDKAQQEFYDLRRPAKECFPVLLERQANTLAIAMSKSRLLREEPELIQAERREPPIGKEEQNDDDSRSVIAKSALSRTSDMTTLSGRNIHRNLEECCLRFKDELPFQHRHLQDYLFSSYDTITWDCCPRRDVNFEGMYLMVWHSLLNATANSLPNTYPVVLLGVKKNTRSANALSTDRRRRSAPLLLKGPKKRIQVSQPSAPHIQARTQPRQKTFHASSDFKWGLLVGLGLGVLTFSMILVGYPYYFHHQAPRY